jgi:hypothetical protein
MINAREFLETMPRDEESSERASVFIALVRASRTSEESARIVAELFKVAGTDAWPLSLHDLNMLMYSLRENPAVIPLVITEVQRILPPISVSSPAVKTWNWIYEQARLKIAS